MTRGAAAEAADMVVRLVDGLDAAEDFVEAAQRGGLTLQHAIALARVRRHGALTISELAEQLGLGASSTSHLVLNLVERGLLQRVEDPRDRRQRNLSITPLGSSLLDAHRRERAVSAARRLGPVPEALLRDLAETVGRCLLHVGGV